jgi:hypothetical protein
MRFYVKLNTYSMIIRTIVSHNTYRLNARKYCEVLPNVSFKIRVLGEITEDKLEIVRESDAILREVVREEGLERDIWQYFTVLPGIQSVGVMGDSRTISNLSSVISPNTRIPKPGPGKGCLHTKCSGRS